MFVLKIKTENAAFEDRELEVARILRDVAQRIEDDYQSGSCRDSNGNLVGDFSFDDVE